ncbi:MAG: hypothetical protein AAB899_04390 [Patescibacteria group bacterium]
MKFDYKRYGKTLRPVIPVTIQYGEIKIGYHVLVDSGADLCIFHEEIGTALGINVRTGRNGVRYRFPFPPEETGGG